MSIWDNLEEYVNNSFGTNVTINKDEVGLPLEAEHEGPTARYPKGPDGYLSHDGSQFGFKLGGAEYKQDGSWNLSAPAGGSEFTIYGNPEGEIGARMNALGGTLSYDDGTLKYGTGLGKEISYNPTWDEWNFKGSIIDDTDAGKRVNEIINSSAQTAASQLLGPNYKATANANLTGVAGDTLSYDSDGFAKALLNNVSGTVTEMIPEGPASQHATPGWGVKFGLDGVNLVSPDGGLFGPGMVPQVTGAIYNQLSEGFLENKNMPEAYDWIYKKGFRPMLDKAGDIKDWISGWQIGDDNANIQLANDGTAKANIIEGSRSFSAGPEGVNYTSPELSFDTGEKTWSRALPGGAVISDGGYRKGMFHVTKDGASYGKPGNLVASTEGFGWGPFSQPSISKSASGDPWKMGDVVDVELTKEDLANYFANFSASY